MHASFRFIYCHYMITPFMECLWHIKFWHLCFKKDQTMKWTTEGQAMVLKINVLQYNRFVFRQWLPFLWEKTGPIHLTLVSLMAGWQRKYGGLSWPYQVFHWMVVCRGLFHWKVFTVVTPSTKIANFPLKQFAIWYTYIPTHTHIAEIHIYTTSIKFAFHIITKHQNCCHVFL